MGDVNIHPTAIVEGECVFDDGVVIGPNVRIYVTESLYIGRDAKIGPNCQIVGRHIRIGDEFYMGAGAKIGGGSCFERQSSLRAGHFLHMGEGSFINTARPVVIGNEVGMGMGTKVFTHGAYLSALDGFPYAFAPVTIGSRVWLPGAIVNPGVVIGDDVVVGVNSLVSKDLPSGCLAGGSPAKVIREGAYPRELSPEERTAFWADFQSDYPYDDDLKFYPLTSNILVNGGEAAFYINFPEHRNIIGKVSDASERLRNQLRRYGIRFYCRPREGSYVTF